MAILIEHQFRNKQMRQAGLIKVVAKLQASITFPADLPLNLKRQVSEASGEQWILASSLYRKAAQGLPVGTDEVGLCVSSQKFLVKSRREDRCAAGFPQASNIAAIEFDQSARAGESRLAGGDLILAQADGAASSGQGDAPTWYVSTAMRHLESDAVRDFVSFGFVYLNQRFFVGLIGDRSAWAYARPVKDVQVV